MLKYFEDIKIISLKRHTSDMFFVSVFLDEFIYGTENICFILFRFLKYYNHR